MSNVLQKQVNWVSGVSVPTSAQTQILYSGRVQVTLPTVRAVVKGFMNITSGTSCVILQARVYRGQFATGSGVGSNILRNTTAGNSDELNFAWSEQLLNVEYVDYSVTLTCVSATAASTVNIGLLEIELING